MTADTSTRAPDDGPLEEVAAHLSRGSVTSLIQRSAVAVVLAVIVLVGVILFGSKFASTANFSNLATSSSFLAIVAIGMTFVIISGGIDLSVGSMYALAAVLAAYGSQWGSFDRHRAAARCLRRARSGPGHVDRSARHATVHHHVGRTVVPRGLAFKVSDDGNTTYLIDQDRWMKNLGQGRWFGVGIPVVIALAVFVAGSVLLNRTRFGQAVFAIGGSEEAANLMGLRVARVKMLVYTLTGALSGLAGMLVASRSSSGLSTIGVGLELEAIAAVVIGGTLLSGGAGGVTGTMIGVLLLGVIQNLINQVGTLRSFHQQVVSGLFLVAVVTAQTIVGRREQT